MRRSQYRRESSKSKWFTGRRRIIAAVATLVAFGGIVTVTQVSDASTKRSSQRALAACDNIQAPKSTKLSTKTRKGTYTTDNGKVTQHADDGAGDVPTAAQMRNRCRQWVAQNAGNTASTKAGQGNNNGGKNNNNGGNNNNGNNNNGNNNGGNNNGGNATPAPGAGLGVIANSCDNSKLKPFTGFQIGDVCVSTQFGEVSSEKNNPSLLITEAPTNVQQNKPFTLKVSTRNLIRDRFLAAGQGGYYVESSVLSGGINRGHFHTACRMLDSTSEAPDASGVPDFFVATEDKKGGKAPDVVTIQVPGLPKSGTAQCTSWAGDGSHRIPMMQRANETPAVDSVRIQVGGGGGNNNGGNNNGNNGGNNNQGQNQNQNKGQQQQNGQVNNQQRDQQNKQRDAQNAQNSQNQNKK